MITQSGTLWSMIIMSAEHIIKTAQADHTNRAIMLERLHMRNNYDILRIEGVHGKVKRDARVLYAHVRDC